MDERQHIRIDQYLSGEMTAEERTAFEREITTDAALAQEVALQRESLGAFREPEVEDLEQKLAEIMQPEGKVRTLRGDWRSWAVAASVVLLLGLGLLYSSPRERLRRAAPLRSFFPLCVPIIKRLKSVGDFLGETEQPTVYLGCAV